MFAATFDALMAIRGREPFHPSIGSPGSFAHRPVIERQVIEPKLMPQEPGTDLRWLM
jgi:hypothetical protein